MKRSLPKLFSLILAIASFGIGIASASDIVANLKNDEPLNKEQLKLMLTGKEKFWESGSEVVIAILKSDPAVDGALAEYTGMTSNKFKNHWQRIAYSGRGKMPRMFSNIEDLVAFVNANRGAIGIVSEEVSSSELRRINLGVYSRNKWAALYALNR
ncbi:hypothetical protein [Pelagicoccus sp. SDUM812002]|uniref:hypothetical protein n=1 Tax=Pelagicoccus sp. SDUM812002 TaxID=3041266 RepID=UPI00280D8EFC|nr:hypothetical protein [Pelagicoccus sp. SDUM812002]MDQ8186816.1 hypothetical protein [Pelagicoccus sp. SDUM812002]